jgi:hypothetical protein
MLLIEKGQRLSVATVATAVLAFGLVIATGTPASAADATGYRSCTGTRSVTVHGNQVSNGWHIYYANGEYKNTYAPTTSWRYQQTWASPQATSWLASAQYLNNVGATCY